MELQVAPPPASVCSSQLFTLRLKQVLPDGTQHLPTAIMLRAESDVERDRGQRVPQPSCNEITSENCSRVVPLSYHGCLEDDFLMEVPPVLSQSRVKFPGSVWHRKQVNEEELCQQDHCGRGHLPDFPSPSLFPMSLSLKA